MKTYNIESKIGPWDFWLVSMKKTYTTPIGISNIVFTLAAIGLSVKFYSKANNWVQLLLLLMCLIFPVFQPIMVYLKAKGQVALIPRGMKFQINDMGIRVSVGDKSELINWSRVTELIEKKQMVIIRVDKSNGYFLTNRALGDERKAFISDVQRKIKRG